MVDFFKSFKGWSLNDWLVFLEERQPTEIQLGLDRIRIVASRLKVLSLNAPVITVGGTNGKGSTIAALEAIYLAAGYRVASYTSPHLHQFNERIRINQLPITNERLVEAFEFVERARFEIALTYFEMVTLAAFWCFSRIQLDVILIEVGLGGRLDATNIIDADLSVITTVDFDHQVYLGHTLAEIAFEKSGILRTNKPFIYGDDCPPETLIEQALKLRCNTIFLNRDFSFKTCGTSFQITDTMEGAVDLPIPIINLKAAAAAIMASRCLNHQLPCSAEQLRNAMERVKIVGRQQVVLGHRTTILDVCHNPQAVKLLASFVTQFKPRKKVYAVFSCLKDKEICALIDGMHEVVDAWYPAILKNKRASSEVVLRAAFKKSLNVEPVFFESPAIAYHAAISAAAPNDLVVVFGSFLTVACVMVEMNSLSWRNENEICS